MISPYVRCFMVGLLRGRGQAESRTTRQWSDANSSAADLVDRPIDEALQEAHEPVDVGEVGGERRPRPGSAPTRTSCSREQLVAEVEERHRLVAARTTAASRGRSSWWAISPAPGLQKQPVRSEMSTWLASSSTRRSSIGRPSRSCIMNVTVPPRSVGVGRSEDLDHRPAVAVAEAGRARRAATRSGSRPARGSASTPMRSRWSSPVATAGRLR